MQFPHVEGENLAGSAFTYPRDFAAARTIALVAFDLRARGDLESWVPFIDRFARDGSVRGRLFPVLSRTLRMMKGVVQSTMRKTAPTPEARDATIPIFVDLDEFCAALDIADRTQIHAFLIEPDGEVSLHRTGRFDEGIGMEIETLLLKAAV